MSPSLASLASPALENGAGDEQDFVYMDSLTTLAVLPQVLNVAIELDLFSIIAKGGHQLTAAEIAAQLPVKNHDVAVSVLDRMLCLLATYSVVTCTLDPDSTGSSSRPQRRYGLTPAAKYLLPDEDGLSLAWVSSLVWHNASIGARDKLKDSVLEGVPPFNMAHGMSAFEYASNNPNLNQVFNNAMDSYSRILIKNILKRYDGFKDIKQLVDVGGGLGHMVSAVVSKYPSIKGINFDLPHVVLDAPSYPGVVQVPGDMFKKVPEGDAIMLKWITHNWNDDQCIKLFKNCYAALPEKGKLIVIEGMLSETPESSVGQKTLSHLDIFMMTQVPAGRERTKEEFTALANAAGFFDIKFDCCVCNSWIIELSK